VFGIHGYPGERAIENRMWALAEQALPPAGRQADHMVAYTQGLMDLGATICSRGKTACLADAEACPLVADCVARRDGLTAVLPTPKPRAAIPERSTVMLIVRHGRRAGAVASDSGIWGGLWSLPEIAVTRCRSIPRLAEDAALELAPRYG
jgi:A/G-specific adenine glycosylase